MRLQNKIALVTGAGSGIGAASAVTYAREGASVVIVDVNETAARGVAEKIRAVGGRAECFVANVAERPAIESMIRFAIEHFGRLDILHNNTATSPIGAVGQVEPAAWQKALDVSLTAYWYASKCALEHMLPRQYGVILNTSSISGIAADFGFGAYNVVKAGVLNLTRSIAIDYARRGIRCNAVCPGIIFTPPYEKIQASAPERIDTLAESVPMGRFGTPQEIANVSLFLVSDEASFVTGSCVVADGGRLAHTGTPSPFGFTPL